MTIEIGTNLATTILTILAVTFFAFLVRKN